MVEVSLAPKNRTCAKCGRTFPSEACLFDGREVFGNVLVLCNACADRLEAERQEEQTKAIQVETVRQWERICPVRFRETDPARLPSAHGLNAVMGWQYGRDGILAHGSTGKGKTRCLYLLLHRLHFNEHRSIVAMGAGDFGHQCGRLFWEDQSRAAGFLERLIRVDVLLLDDLDKARFTDRVEAELFHVIDARTANGMPVLASLNATGDSLAALLSEHRGWPLVRRLRDYCHVIDFDESKPNQPQPVEDD